MIVAMKIAFPGMWHHADWHNHFILQHHEVHTALVFSVLKSWIMVLQTILMFYEGLWH